MNEKELMEKLMPGPELIIEGSRHSAMLPDVVARHVIENALTTPITIERECPNCKGAGRKRVLSFPQDRVGADGGICLKCNGTGEQSITFTIKELIEEKLK